MAIARLDGPLQDDAALALGKIGDKRALETLAQLQRTAPRQFQPSIAAAICLLGVNCETHENFLAESLKFADKHLGFQELLRGAAMGLAAVGVAGHAEAAASLFDGVENTTPTATDVVTGGGRYLSVASNGSDTVMAYYDAGSGVLKVRPGPALD